MTSLLTNSAAMTALSNLSGISNNLAANNNRMSTGLQVGQASDNAAYWSIGARTGADAATLGAVADAIAIGQADLEVAGSGLNSAFENLSAIKTLLVSAQQPGVDRAAIQTQVNGLLADIQTTARASLSGGEARLTVDTDAPGYNGTASFVASFDGTARVGTVDLAKSDLILFDDAATATGIMDKARTGLAGGIESLNGNAISTLTNSAADLATLDSFIAAVDEGLGDTLSAINTVGLAQTRLASAAAYSASVADVNNQTIGGLADANIAKEATKLQALQAQQQLAIQSLSVANASAQKILGLFK